MQRVILFTMALLVLIPSCGPKGSPLPERLEVVNYQHQLPYDLNNPAEKFRLPDDLEEISGLSILDPEHLLAIQDEEGRAYVIQAATGKVKREIKFHKSGDYEGIEAVGQDIYVTKSNGKIYRFTLTDSTDRYKSWEFKTALDLRNDVEGLAYNPKTGKLLIALKDDPDVKGYDAQGKAIYAFDLALGQLEEQPLFTIEKKQIKSYFEKQGGKTHGDITFQPSGIAIHPITQEIYIISTAGKLLVVVNEQGVIQDVAQIDPDVLRQPEGLCFQADGTLFISSEGRGGKGYICRFDML